MKSISPAVFLERINRHYADEICHLYWEKEKPWTLLFAVILSAQCTDKRVNQVTPNLFKNFPTLEHFAIKPIEMIESDIRSTGFFRTKARHLQESAKKILTDFDGKLPDSMKNLILLSGVGRKTANVILWNVFGKNEGFVVDTHVSRIAFRTGSTREKNPEKIEKDLMKKLPKKFWGRTSHQLVQFGRDFCKAPKPKCEKCFLKKICPKRGVVKR